MENVGDDANSVIDKGLKFFKSDTICVTLIIVTFEIFRKCSEIVAIDDDLQVDMKIFKSNTFENYKSFVPSEVQNHFLCMGLIICLYYYQSIICNQNTIFNFFDDYVNYTQVNSN